MQRWTSTRQDTRTTGIARGVVLAALVSVFAMALPGAGYQRPGLTKWASVPAPGVDVPKGCSGSDLSPHSSRGVVTGTGRYVAFDSCAQGLVRGDGNDARDVFIRDMHSGKTTLVSAPAAGTAPVLPVDLPTCRKADLSQRPSVDSSGRFVVFESCSSRLVPLGQDRNLADYDVFLADRRTGAIELVSIGPDGKQLVGGPSSTASISRNGRYVTFTHADAVVGPGHVFRRDLKTKKTVQIDVTPQGQSANGTSSCAFATSNGSFVVFESNATDLVASSQPWVAGSPFSAQPASVFVRDLKTKRTELISGFDADETDIASGAAASGSTLGCRFSAVPTAISENGRYVAFTSGLRTLVPNDTNGPDTFVIDRTAGRTERVSVSSVGEESCCSPPTSVTASLSADGRFVALTSWSSLHNGATCSAVMASPGCVPSAYVHDRATGALDWLSRTWDGKDPAGSSFATGLSSTGRYAVFEDHTSDDVVRGDRNHAKDVYWRDRGLPLGLGQMAASGRSASVTVEGVPSFTRTGTAFFRDATSDDRVSEPGGASDLIGVRLAHRPQPGDLLVVLEVDRMPRTPALAAMTAGSVFGASFSVDDRAYEIRAASTGVTPAGGTAAQFGLFSCTGTVGPCTHVASLKGGFGTTGDRITMSVPLDALRITDRTVISGLHAYAAQGTFFTGPLEVLDAVR